MKILVDLNIPYVKQLFGMNNQVEFFDGRMISNTTLKNIDVLIIRSVTKINYELLQNSCVKFVGTVTSGVDHVDQDCLKKENIAFAFAPGSNAISVVEYVLNALFCLAQREHFFLRDKIVGIIGVGHIGSLLFQRLCDFGVQTLLYDPYIPKKKFNGNWKSFDSLISESDILTFHTSLTYSGSYPTWHMVNLDVLEAIPTNSILINTARGAIIDNLALLKVLQSKKRIKVVLDVWESEPYLLSPLLSYVNIGTAHIAGYTVESKIRSIMDIYNKYCNYFNIFKKIDLWDMLTIYKKYIKIKKIDEVLIGQLIYDVHDIYADYSALKRCNIQLGEFDLLRNYYRNRREWSYFHVNTGKDYMDEELMNLGFSVY